jgi:hypothetical protein
MSGTDYNAPEFNVDNANTSVSGEYFEGGLQQLDDASNNITLYVSKEIMNQIFLFYSDDTTGGSTESNDLSDFSNTDMKYALNVQQWNVKLQTTKEDRKHVITNLLIDLFGGGALEALKNIDVFSNEEQLDSDISDIFQTRATQIQRDQIGISKHGYFTHNASLSSVNHQKLIDASSNDIDALTRQLLETANLAAHNNPSNTVLRRQFDTTNTSNVDYNLPTGWRTFQFIDGDTFSYNLTIKQLSTLFPAWSLNQSALSGGSLPTSYRVKLHICEEPSGQTGIFITPSITINQVDTVNASTAFNNVITTNITSTTVQTSDITTSTILSADANILFETTITIANVIFDNLSETEKTNITQQIKELYAQQLNVNTESILITLSAGSLIINVKIYNVLLSAAGLIYRNPTGVTNTTTTITRSGNFDAWKGWNPAENWSLYFRAYKATTSNYTSVFFFSDNVSTFGNHGTMDWTATGSLTLRWQANGSDEIIVNSSLTQSSHIEVLFAYSKSDYTHDGGGSDPDLGTGLRWYVRTASSASGLLSATWNEITTNVTQDNFDESDDITWPANADLNLGSSSNGLYPFSASNQGSVTNVELWNTVRSTSDY